LGEDGAEDGTVAGMTQMGWGVAACGVREVDVIWGGGVGEKR